jgi:arylsulfatase A-like enzyme
MDKSLGDLMNYLDKNNLTDNTAIIFISDNGGFSLEPRYGKRFTHNTPLRAGKGSMYEGGIRVPMLVKYPGIAAANSVTSTPVIIEDLFPTVLQMAAVKKYKTIQQIDGQSFLPVLHHSETKAKERNLIWHFPNKWIPEEDEAVSWVSAIRSGQWKLIYFHKTGKLELYNIENDIGEKNNLSISEAIILKKMANLLSKNLKKENALMPVFKSTGKSVPYNSINDK